MTPVSFPEKTLDLGRPLDMTEEECGSLPVHIERPKDATSKIFRSCWKASFKERLSILFFGKVWLGVMSQYHPVVFMQATKTVFAKPSTSVRERS